MSTYKRSLLMLIALSVTCVHAGACEIRTRHFIGYNCPHVTYRPEDCQKSAQLWRAGEIVDTDGQINIMSSGHSYFCSSGCIEMKDLAFKDCVLEHVSAKKGESKEFVGYIFVGDRKSVSKMVNAYSKSRP